MEGSEAHLQCPHCAAAIKPKNPLPSGVYSGRCKSCGKSFTFRAVRASEDGATQRVARAPSDAAAVFAGSSELNFVLNGQNVRITNPDPSMTLNEFIRSRRNLTGTKRSCNEGGCGACVVAMSRDGTTVAVNSCLKPLCAVDGWTVTTTEGIGSNKAGFHPVQEKIASGNGSQCGFCTPGMVMSMYSLLQSNPTPTMQDVEDAFDGNICRCTGYRPILEAFKSFAIDAPHHATYGGIADIEEAARKASAGGVCASAAGGCSSGGCGSGGCGCAKSGSCGSKGACGDMPTCSFRPIGTKCPGVAACNVPSTSLSGGCVPCASGVGAVPARALRFAANGVTWYQPTTLTDAFVLMRQHAGAYKLVAGNTGTGIFKDDKAPVLIDIRCIPELSVVSADAQKGVTIGAAVTITGVIATLTANSALSASYATAVAHLKKIAGKPVRNAATWAGNLMLVHNHADFPSDMCTVLAGLGATVRVDSCTGTSMVGVMDLLTLDMTGRIITSVTIPVLAADEVFQSYKVMPRHTNAHAYVNAAFRFKLDASQRISSPVLIYGGIGPELVRASATEAYLSGQSLTDVTLGGAVTSLMKELVPDNPPVAASPDYRKGLAASLLFKFIVKLVGAKADPRVQSAGTEFVRPVSSGVQSFTSDQSEYPVSQPVVKLSSHIQASGEAQYTEDIPPPSNTLFGAFVITTVGSATIASIDATAALAMPGVVRFLTAKDIPAKGQNNCSPDTPEELFCSGTVLYAGQSVGLIVADTQAHADAAAKAVVVTYTNVQKPILTIQDAVAAKKFFDNPIPPLAMGDVDKAFPTCAHVIEGSVECGSQYHFHLETQVTLAVPEDNGGFTIHSAAQWPDYVQKSVSQTTGVPINMVSVEVKRVGGAYGGKITRNLSTASAAAVAASVLGCTVRVAVNLETNMAMIGKRHPFLANYKVGVDANGVLTAIQLDYYVDSGCNVNDSPGCLAMAFDACDNAYYAPNWKVTGYLCQTNLPSNTAMRAPGCVPAIFIIETVMDHVAKSLGVDPDALRFANLVQNGSVTPYGQTVSNCTLPAVWTQLKQQADYDNRRAAVADFNAKNRWRKRGITIMPLKYGIAWGGYTCGGHVSVYADGTVGITHSGCEIGQGINTKVAQVAAYTLGIDMSNIVIRTTRTDLHPNAAPTGGSITSELNCAAVQQACKNLLAVIDPVRKTLPAGTPWPQVVAACLGQGVDLSNRAWYLGASTGPFNYSSFGATAIEVEMDILTGESQIIRTDIVFDCGISLSPLIDIGQVEGGFVQGLGYWMSEKLTFDTGSGRLLSNNTWEYKPPAAKDIPIDFRITMLPNTPNPDGFLRSKATGEPPYCMACSVLFAMKNAVTAARAEIGQDKDYYAVNGPFTVDAVRAASLVDPSQFSF